MYKLNRYVMMWKNLNLSLFLDPEQKHGSFGLKSGYINSTGTEIII